jgi:hypothetical protein
MNLKIIFTILLFVIFPLIVFGQMDNYKIHLGATGTFSLKMSFFDQDHKTTEHYKPFFASLVAGTLYIEDPNSLSFLLKLGICYDADDYLVNNNNGVSVHTDQLNIAFNPEVLFPFSNQKFKIGVGIGVEYLLTKELNINGESGSLINKLYYYGNLQDKQRNLIPFINADFWYEYSPKIWFAVGIKQPLLSSYYSNETMDFGGASFNLRHQPTYFSASVYYQFF